MCGGHRDYRYITVPVQERTRVQERNAGQMCPACGAPVEPDFVVCPNCGTQLKAACPSCHKAVDVSWVACPYCGANLRENG